MVRFDFVPQNIFNMQMDAKVILYTELVSKLEASRNLCQYAIEQYKKADILNRKCYSIWKSEKIVARNDILMNANVPIEEALKILNMVRLQLPKEVVLLYPPLTEKVKYDDTYAYPYSKTHSFLLRFCNPVVGQQVVHSNIRKQVEVITVMLKSIEYQIKMMVHLRKSSKNQLVFHAERRRSSISRLLIPHHALVA